KYSMYIIREYLPAEYKIWIEENVKEQFLKDLTKQNMKAYLNSNEFKRLTLQKRYSAIQDKLDNKYSMYIIREYLPAEYKIWIEENVKEQFLKDLTKQNMKAYLNSDEFKRLTLQKRYSAIQDKLDNKYSMYIIRKYLPTEYKIKIKEIVKDQFLKDLAKQNMKAYLNSDEFKRLALNKPYLAIEDKLDNKYSMYIIRKYLPTEYKIKIKEIVKDQFLKDLANRNMKAYLNSDEFKRLSLAKRYSAIQDKLDNKYSLSLIKKYLPAAYKIKKINQEQIFEAYEDAELKDFIDNEILKFLKEDRLVAIVEKMKELKLFFSSNDLGRFYYKSPKQLTSKISKKDIQMVYVSKPVYDQFRAGLLDQDMQDYLNSDEFWEIPRDHKLAAIVKKLGMRGYLAHLFTALPYQLSSRITKEDIGKVDVSTMVYDQLQTAFDDPRAQKYFKQYLAQPLKKKILADDLLKMINGFGYHISLNPITLYRLLPLNIKNYVELVKNDYFTDSDGQVVIKIYRLGYKLYNFSKLPAPAGFWENRNIVPLWNNAGKIAAFEVDNPEGSTFTIQANDVLELGNVMKAVTQYGGENVWKEVIAEEVQDDDEFLINDWLETLLEIIRSYKGIDEEHVQDYMYFLVALLELEKVQGASVDEILEMAVSRTGIDVEEAKRFLHYMSSPGVHAEGVKIEKILSAKTINYLKEDNALLVDEENISKAPGGIDFNPDLLELEIQGQGQDFNLPDTEHNFKHIKIKNGLIPVIINITPITNLPLIIGAVENAEDQLSSAR
ncbi:MAG: hypothetical protein KBD53_00385, partial [Candidatus Omnitrophica bacterium]|nr:hypothetical protein [Candidatus Omnitrophota bacterium]